MKLFKKVIGGIKVCASYLVFRVRHQGVRYYPEGSLGEYYSQDGQDVYLSKLLFNKIDKLLTSGVQPVFVDIGCNHPIKFSNSYFFEKYFKFKVLAVDPLDRYKALWEKYRSGSVFNQCALGEVEGVVELTVPLEGQFVDDMHSSLCNTSKLEGYKTSKKSVKMKTLTQLLNEQSIREVLICSIDVEGFELEVLKGLDFNQFQIDCFCIENNESNPYGSEELRSFLLNKGYSFVARLGMLDDVYVIRTLLGQYK
jgi:FkbM family methyltransferase